VSSDERRYYVNPLFVRKGRAYQIQVGPRKLVEAEAGVMDALLACFEDARQGLTAAEIQGRLGQVLPDEPHGAQVAELARNGVLVSDEVALPGLVEEILRPLHVDVRIAEVQATLSRGKEEARPVAEREARRRQSIFFANDVAEEQAAFFSGWLIAAARLGYRFSIEAFSRGLRIVAQNQAGEKRMFGDFRYIDEADPRAEYATENKAIANYMLGLAGLPATEQAMVDFADLDSACEFAQRVGYPVVLKPVWGEDGRDVFPGLASADEVVAVANRLRERWDGRGGVVIEKHVEGNNYRILVLGSEILGVYGGAPVFVVGDGKSSVQELIEEVNREKRASRAHERGEKLIDLADDELARCMSERSLRMDSVLPEGARFQLNKNLNRGKGVRVLKLDSGALHPEVKEMAIQAVKLFGLHLGAVDYIAPSLDVPPGESGRICEVQAHPALLPEVMDIEAAVVKCFMAAFAVPPGVPSARVAVTETRGTLRPFPHRLAKR